MIQKSLIHITDPTSYGYDIGNCFSKVDKTSYRNGINETLSDEWYVGSTVRNVDRIPN